MVMPIILINARTCYLVNSQFNTCLLVTNLIAIMEGTDCSSSSSHDSSGEMGTHRYLGKDSIFSIQCRASVHTIQTFAFNFVVGY